MNDYELIPEMVDRVVAGRYLTTAEIRRKTFARRLPSGQVLRSRDAKLLHRVADTVWLRYANRRIEEVWKTL